MQHVKLKNIKIITIFIQDYFPLFILYYEIKHDVKISALY